MTFIHPPDHLYWGDLSLGSIERTNFSGKKRMQIRLPPSLGVSTAAVSLEISGDFLSWTVMHEQTFYTVNIDDWNHVLKIKIGKYYCCTSWCLFIVLKTSCL